MVSEGSLLADESTQPLEFMVQALSERESEINDSRSTDHEEVEAQYRGSLDLIGNVKKKLNEIEVSPYISYLRPVSYTHLTLPTSG